MKCRTDPEQTQLSADTLVSAVLLEDGLELYNIPAVLALHDDPRPLSQRVDIGCVACGETGRWRAY